MKNAFLITTFLLVAHAFAHAQGAPAAYEPLVRAADSLLAQKQYLPAAQKYSAAFKSFGWKGYTTHRYDAARSWAFAGVADSAFFNLERITAKANFGDFNALEQEPAFAALRSDARWPELIKQAKKNSGINEATFNGNLFQLIDSLAREDQKWRHLSREMRNSGNSDSVKLAETYEMMRRTDSLNHLALIDIVARHGFPDYDQLGAEGTHNFWLLMQHQDQHPDFQEDVLKRMEIAVGQQKADGKDYAYLLDRVMVNTGKQQVYGTQMTLNAEGTSFEPKPCVDPENLDKRRASVGLGTIAAYIEIMNQNYRGSLKSKN
jgi:hypothetical protein